MMAPRTMDSNGTDQQQPQQTRRYSDGPLSDPGAFVEEANAATTSAGRSARRSTWLGISGDSKEWELSEEIFDLWDVDGDGYVDRSELGRDVEDCLDAHGIDDLRLLEVFDTVDQNGDHKLDRREFGLFLIRLAKSAHVPVETLTASLRDHLTSKGNEVEEEEEEISEEEAAVRAQMKGWERMHELFDLLDTNNDGTIGRDEIEEGIIQFRRRADLKISLADCLTLLDEAHEEHGETGSENSLDRREFGAFLSQFSQVSGAPLDEVTEFLLRIAKDISDVHHCRRRQDYDMEAKIAEGWKMMPVLFDTWDVQNEGSLVLKEVMGIVRRLIVEEGLSITLKDCHDILVEVDPRDRRRLDRREFGCFLSRFAVAADVTLNEVTYYLMKQIRGKHRTALRSNSDSQALQQGFLDLPKLFELLDKDKDGYISREDLAIAVNKFRTAKKCKISLAESLQLLDEVEQNNERVLDQMEFGAFLVRFALAAGEKLDEMTSFLLGEYQEKKVGGFGRFFALANIGMAEEGNETTRRKASRWG